jgi:ABC-2 type transport system permease protein
MKLSRKTLRIGTFTLIATAIVLAVVIALNLLASELPAAVKSIDTTKEKLFTIGDETKDILSRVEDEVNIYMIVETGSETTVTETVEGLIGQYTDENSNIKYKSVDPAIYPNFTKNYTEDTLSSGSVIVASGKRNRIIPGNEWYMYETSEGRITTEQYEQYSMMYSYYGQPFEATEVFLGETNLTGAISYVTSDVSSKIYMLTGHGEQQIQSAFGSYITDSNIETESLNLLTGDGTVPDDCTMIMILYPSQDLTAPEVKTISEYCTNGGSVFLVTYVGYYSAETQPNVASLAAALGMESVDGMVFDGDPTGYQAYQYNLIPSLSPSCPEALWNESALTYCLTYAHGIVEHEGTGAEFFPLLTTTDSSYLKTDINNVTTLEKEDDDVEGPFNVAAASTIDSGDAEGKMIWFSTPAIFDSSADFGGNSSLFKSILRWTCSGEMPVTVDPKVISNEDLVLTEAEQNTWKTVLVAVLPIAVLGAGFAVWYTRRRKR